MLDPFYPARPIEGMRSLSELRPNEHAVVLELQGGYGFRGRLAALGFTPGAEVQMLRNLSRGPVIVNIRDTRIVLGRREAERVLVTLTRNHDGSSN